MRRLADAIVTTSNLITGSYGPDVSPEAVTWRRVAKIGEEHGEVIEALLGAIGENPRKGVTGSLDEVRKELLDVANCALGAYAHLTPGDDPVAALADHSNRCLDRLRKAMGL